MSPLAAASGLPLSSDSSSASCSPLALISSASEYMSPARFEGLTLRSGPSSAARAAAAARSTSSAPAKATSQIASPVAGSIVSNTRPSAASARSPPITSGCGPAWTNSRAAGERASAVAVAIDPHRRAAADPAPARRFPDQQPWIRARTPITSAAATGMLRYRQAGLSGSESQPRTPAGDGCGASGGGRAAGRGAGARPRPRRRRPRIRTAGGTTRRPPAAPPPRTAPTEAEPGSRRRRRRGGSGPGAPAPFPAARGSLR